jgi:hypothetical protein
MPKKVEHAVGNKILYLSLMLVIFNVGCIGRDPKPDRPEGVYQVDIDKEKNVKVIRIRRFEYVGLPSPEGWVGWQTFSYTLTVPLGHLRNSLNPVINGPDMSGDSGFGYVIFDEEMKTISIHMRQLQYKNGFIFDKNHGGGVRSIIVTGDVECPINGEYHISIPHVFD